MTGNPKPPITISELSQELNLSIGTISSVLSNQYKKRRIPEKTAQRVLETARKAGYIPNVTARRLRSLGSQSHPLTIAMITSLESPLVLIGETTKALQKISREEQFAHLNYITIVDLFNAGQLEKLPCLLNGNHFNAAIITNTIDEDDNFLLNTPPPTPTVLIGREISGYTSVSELSIATGQQAAEVLYNAHTKNFAFLRTNLITQATQKRMAGFIQKVESLTGNKPVEIVASGFSDRDGFEATDHFLKQGRKFDGLFTVMDSLVLGAYHAIKKNNLKIPTDVAVIGSGEHPTAPYIDPPLSAFMGSQFNMQDEAARLLFKQITGEITSPTQTMIPAIPALRESTRRGNLLNNEYSY